MAGGTFLSPKNQACGTLRHIPDIIGDVVLELPQCLAFHLAISRLLIIANTAIRTDTENRYCLNDLHKAAGSLKHHQPAKFAENSTTQDLIQAIREQSPNSEIDPHHSVCGGSNPGQRLGAASSFEGSRFFKRDPSENSLNAENSKINPIFAAKNVTSTNPEAHMSHKKLPVHVVRLINRAITDAETRAEAAALLRDLQAAVLKISPETLIATAMMGEPEGEDAMDALRREILAPFKRMALIEAEIIAAEKELQPLVIEAAQRVLEKSGELESIQRSLLGLRREQRAGREPSGQKLKWMQAGLSSAEIGRLIDGSRADRQGEIDALEKDEARLAAEIEQLGQFQKTMDTSLLPSGFEIREPSPAISAPPLGGLLTVDRPALHG